MIAQIAVSMTTMVTRETRIPAVCRFSPEEYRLVLFCTSRETIASTR